MSFRAWFVAFGLALGWLPGAMAQYPSKPVRLVVPYAAGGPTDLTARLLGERLADLWKQPVIVENKPGASGNIGAQAVISAAPDGYTLLLTATSGVIITQATMRHPAFDTLRDLAPISSVVDSPLVLVVDKSLPVDDVKGLIAYIRERPGKISYGSAGPGALNHIGVELLKLRVPFQALHVPYKGDAPVVTDLINGSLTFSFLSANLAIAQIKAGKLKGLAVSGRARSEAIPELPTMIEAGVPDFELKAGSGILGPKAMPAELVAFVNQSVVQALGQPELKRRFLQSGLMVEPSTPEQFSERIRREIEMWRSVVARAKIPLL